MTRDEVSRFARLMEAKLKDNDHKGGWETDSTEHLLHKLECELFELKTAVEDGDSKKDIVSECVDVGNFAMMIADKVLRE